MRPVRPRRPTINNIPTYITPKGIFRVYGGAGLGDAWVSISYLIRLSDRHKRPIILSSIDKYGNDKYPMLYEILDVFNARNKINITQRPSTRELDFSVWKQTALPIPNHHWQQNKYRRICYQFDGVSNAVKKNPPPQDIPRLINFIPGYEFVQLGQPLTINQDIAKLLQCDLFIGVCSGISFIAHSVSCPTFLIQYNNQLELWHQNKQYMKCVGTDDAITKIKQYLM